MRESPEVDWVRVFRCKGATSNQGEKMDYPGNAVLTTVAIWGKKDTLKKCQIDQIF